jgi:hypothetical protein
MKGSGFFDSIGQKVSSATSSVGNAVSGSIATGLLNVILKADNSALNLYQASARAIARRNPDKVPKAEDFLVRFSAAIRKGLDEGLALSKTTIPAIQPVKATPGMDLNSTRTNSALRKGGKRTKRNRQTYK